MWTGCILQVGICSSCGSLPEAALQSGCHVSSLSACIKQHQSVGFGTMLPSPSTVRSNQGHASILLASVFHSHARQAVALSVTLLRRQICHNFRKRIGTVCHTVRVPSMQQWLCYVGGFGSSASPRAQGFWYFTAEHPVSRTWFQRVLWHCSPPTHSLLE